MQNVIIFVAHDDDAEIAMGGTILRYLNEGKRVIKVVFSAGQMSHPHFREEIIIKKRKQETKEICKKYGIDVIFFELEDRRLNEELKKEDILNKASGIVKKYSPVKIFLPSLNDLHSDHRAVARAMLNMLNVIGYKGEVMLFEVWNLVSENLPVVYVDISEYFGKKVEMVKQFRSQWLSVYLLLIPMYIRARRYGWRNNYKYAERFYKIK